MNEQLLSLDINKVVTGTQSVRIGQGDMSGTTIKASIYDNGTAYDLTGKRARFLMRLPGRHGYVLDESCTVNHNVITYVVDEEHCCVVSGMTDEAYFEILVGGDVVASTARFKVRIHRAAESGGIPAGTYDTRVEELIRQMQHIIDHGGGGTWSLPIATTTRLGAVKADGTTVTVDADGTLHAAGGGGGGGGGGYTRYGYIGNPNYDSKAYIYGIEDGTYVLPDLAAIRSNQYRSCTNTVTLDFPLASTMGESAFANSPNLREVTAPLCTNVAKDAFFSCDALSRVSFPLCTTIGATALTRCGSLLVADFPSCQYVGYGAFTADRSLTTVNLPRCVSVESAAFAMCDSLASVSLPMCEIVGSYAFSGCRSLVSVSLPSCVTLHEQAFMECYSLASVSLPSCVTVGSGAFQKCSALRGISLPACTQVGSNAFEDCDSLSYAYLPSCTTVSSNAFRYCGSLATVTLPVCTTIRGSAFAACKTLASVNLPSCVTIGTNAFYGASALSAISAPACESIGKDAFTTCRLASVALPACRSVGEQAFYSCKSLTTLSLPSIEAIGSGAFFGCTILSMVDLVGVASVPTLPSIDAFAYTPIYNASSQAAEYGYVLVPSSLYNAFSVAPNWSLLFSHGRIVSAMPSGTVSVIDHNLTMSGIGSISDGNLTVPASVSDGNLTF